MIPLCLTVITKNEARCVTRCLLSAKNLVDRMLVLDTGSADQTVALAQEAGAEVHTAIWTGSFSDARNRSLELANAEWCLVLDADEWIDPGMKRETLEQHIAGEGASGAAGSIKIRSNVEVDGVEGYADSWIPRLLPGYTRYRGRIHEQPITCGPDARLDFLVHHDGYAAEQAHAKHDRNLTLLKRALEEDPNSAYLHFQLGVQYETVRQWPKVVFHLTHARDLGADQQAYAHGLFCRLIHALARCDRLNESLSLGLSAKERWPDSSDVHFAFGNVCLDAAVANPKDAVGVWLPAAQSAWLECLQLGDASVYPDHFIGRGGHLAAHNLASVYEGLGDTGLAQEFRALASALRSRL